MTCDSLCCLFVHGLSLCLQAHHAPGSFWLASLLWPPITLLLGRRGLAVMPLAAVAVSACVALTGQVAALCAMCDTVSDTQGTQYLTHCNSGRATDSGTGTQQTGDQQNSPGAAPAITRGMLQNKNAVPTAALRAAVRACMAGALALHAVSSALFFATGHFCEFTGLQYASPFIGYDTMEW